jgi:hypothetical protein
MTTNPPDPCLEQRNALNQTDLEIAQTSQRMAADGALLIQKVQLRELQQAALDACLLAHPLTGPQAQIQFINPEFLNTTAQDVVDKIGVIQSLVKG